MKITYFEACDFETYPVGGTLSFARQLIDALPDAFKLVGIVRSDEPVGKWFIKNINGKPYDYFGICTIEDVKSSWFPKRLFTYFALRRHISAISKVDINGIFSQSPQFVFILSKFNWGKFVYLFAGLGNAVGLSKYRYLRLFGQVYEKSLFNHLHKHADKILAASDIKSIKKISIKYKLPKNFILSFPTRFDGSIFKVLDQTECRKKLKLPYDKKLLITSGRLSYIKGWKFIVDSFRILTNLVPDTILVFLGDGEDRGRIENYCSKEVKNGTIIIGGQKNPREVTLYLNASDVFILGSLVEGWPTSMVEALACGKPIVTTSISGAQEMIDEEKNGFIALERKCEIFAEFILKALSLPNPNPISIQKAKKYTKEQLGYDFIKIWEDESY